MPSLEPAPDGARDWAAALVRTNMREAYARHGLCWDASAFAADWDAGENYLLRRSGEVVGYARLVHDADRSYLRDLQIAAEHRGRGLGRQALEAAGALARRRGSRVLRLRVFADSPAVRLYRRCGFVACRHEPPLIGMERRLPGPGETPPAPRRGDRRGR